MFELAVAAETIRKDRSWCLGDAKPSISRNDGLAGAARALLNASPYRSIRSVECDCVDGVLKLSGQVPSYHQKQLAQETVKYLSGVRAVVNAVHVVKPDCAHVRRIAVAHTWRRDQEELVRLETVTPSSLPC